MFCRARRCGGAVVLGLALSSGMAAAERPDTRIAFSMGFIAGSIDYGEHSPWSISATEDGKLVIKNSDNPNAWQVYGKKPPTQNYSAHVDVASDIRADEKKAAGAGIFFGAVSQGGKTDFYALLLAEASVQVLQHENGSWKRVLSKSGSSIHNSGMNTLGVVVRADNFEVAVNGEKFASVQFENNEKTGLGVFVGGAGTSVFSNFVVHDDKGEQLQSRHTPQPPEPTTATYSASQERVAPPPARPSAPVASQPVPAAANQWAAIDPELTQAIFGAHAAAQKLCEDGKQGACGWLKYARPPEQVIAGQINKLREWCRQIDRGWEEPPPRPRFGGGTSDIPASICRTHKRARANVIADFIEQTRALTEGVAYWVTIDAEWTKAIVDRYAVVTKLCEAGNQGACTWLKNNRRPEDRAEEMIKFLRYSCVHSSRGWELPPPGGSSTLTGEDFDQWICHRRMEIRNDDIADARFIIDNPAQVTWATEEQYRKAAHQRFQIMMEGQIQETKEHNIDQKLRSGLNGLTPMHSDIRQGVYDRCLAGLEPCPPGVRESEATARHPGGYIGN
jgi:hypothetical protein